jgi:hypothetical protein
MNDKHVTKIADEVRLIGRTWTKLERMLADRSKPGYPWPIIAPAAPGDHDLGIDPPIRQPLMDQHCESA